MPILAKSVASTLLTSGDCLTLVNEAAPYSVPPFYFYASESQTPYAYSTELVPIGARVLFSTSTSELNSKRQLIPVLVAHFGVLGGVQPYPVYPLQDALDVSIHMDPTSEFFHVHWWWNAWSPDWSFGFSELQDSLSPLSPPSPPGSPPIPPESHDRYRTNRLPAPPVHHYRSHSVPSLDNPPFLKSLAPKALPGAFDPRRPFWVAPVAEGYLYDPLPGWPRSIELGLDQESPRLPDTPGARLFLSMVQRGVVEYPREDNTALPADHSTEPNLDPEGNYASWVLRGGVVGARQHVMIASAQDKPEFVSVAQTGELVEFPEDAAIPETCTVEDHAVILRALKAHIDHRALSNASRVLMYSKGQLVRGKFKPRQTRLKGPTGPPFGTSWPAQEQEGSEVPVLVLEHPVPVFWNTLTNNYRLMLNEDKVLYPELDYSEFTFFNNHSNYLHMGSTAHRDHDPQMDFVLSDPHDFFQPEVFQGKVDLGTL